MNQNIDTCIRIWDKIENLFVLCIPTHLSKLPLSIIFFGGRWVGVGVGETLPKNPDKQRKI